MTPAFPRPLRSQTAARWRITAQRRRIIYDDWRSDLEERLRQAIGHVRKDAWGIPDLSSNLLRSSVTQLAALYDREPIVSHDEDVSVLLDEVRHSGLWPLMSRVQRDCLGLREMFVRVDVVGEPGDEELCYRPAFPDLVEAEASGEYPEDPVRIREAILRTRERDNTQVWTFDSFDISNPAAPRYRVEDEDGKDVSAEFGLTTLEGDAYTWRRSDGKPVMPYAMYHAAQTGQLFDPTEGQSLVEATLNLGVHWTFYGHVLTNCSWPQRYMVNCKVPGTTLQDGAPQGSGHVFGSESSGAEGIVTDPATVIELVSDQDNPGAVMVGQWKPGADPATVQESISLYERRAAATGGISPADIQRVAGDPRSGFALAISREGQREAQRRFEPQFRHGDLDVLELSAILWNRATGSTFPEEDYRIAYEAIPHSAEEQKAEREHLLALLAAGLISRVEVYRQLHPGITEADASDALDAIGGVNRTTDPAAEPVLTDPVLDPAAPAVAAGAPLAATALNGAQVQSAQSIVMSVATGALPRSSGVAMLVEFFQLSEPAAERVMGEVGRGFVPAVAPAPTPMPAAPAPQ